MQKYIFIMEEKGNDYLDDNICNVEGNNFVGSDSVNGEVYVKEKQYENNPVNGNTVNIQENSTFIEDEEKDLYENVSWKNEIKVELEEVTSLAVDIKDKSLTITQYCEHCNKYYDSFCMKCFMVSRIFDNRIGKNDIDRAKKTLPKYILNIKQSGDGTEGVFASRTIPEGIYFGPFDGLKAIKQIVGYIWKLKCGKFVNIGNESNVNWMHYVKCAKQIEDRNLIIFQCKGNLYYRSDREINIGDELLIYHKKQQVKLNGETEQYCHPIIKKNMSDVYACTFCCLGFSTRFYLVKHKIDCPFMLNDEVTEEGIIRCPYCKIYLDKREYLEFHFNYCHERYKGGFKTEKVAAITHKKFKCNKCDYKSKYKRNFELHVNNKHVQNDKRFKCSKCKYQTNYKICFDSHSYKHGETKPFECNVCSREFSRKSNFNRHNCTGEKLFHCGICNRKYTNRRDLVLHMQVKHVENGAKNYKCPKCPYETNYKSSLNRHSVRHTNVKSSKRRYVVHNGSFECELCLKMFACKQTLKRHRRRHAVEEETFLS